MTKYTAKQHGYEAVQFTAGNTHEWWPVLDELRRSGCEWDVALRGGRLELHVQHDSIVGMHAQDGDWLLKTANGWYVLPAPLFQQMLEAESKPLPRLLVAHTWQGDELKPTHTIQDISGFIAPDDLLKMTGGVCNADAVPQEYDGFLLEFPYDGFAFTTARALGPSVAHLLGYRLNFAQYRCLGAIMLPVVDGQARCYFTLCDQYGSAVRRAK